MSVHWLDSFYPHINNTMGWKFPLPWVGLHVYRWHGSVYGGCVIQYTRVTAAFSCIHLRNLVSCALLIWNQIHTDVLCDIWAVKICCSKLCLVTMGQGVFSHTQVRKTWLLKEWEFTFQRVPSWSKILLRIILFDRKRCGWVWTAQLEYCLNNIINILNLFISST